MKDFYFLEEIDGLLVIVYKEVENTTVNQIHEYFDYLTKFSDGKKFHLIIDLSRAKPPSAEVRAALKLRFKLLEEKVVSYHVFVGVNILLKIAVKFVGASIGLENFKLCNSIEQAHERIKSAS